MKKRDGKKLTWKINSTFKFNYSVEFCLSDKVQNFQLELGSHKQSQENKE